MARPLARCLSRMPAKLTTGSVIHRISLYGSQVLKRKEILAGALEPFVLKALGVTHRRGIVERATGAGKNLPRAVRPNQKGSR